MKHWIERLSREFDNKGREHENAAYGSAQKGETSDLDGAKAEVYRSIAWKLRHEVTTFELRELAKKDAQIEKLSVALKEAGIDPRKVLVGE